MAQTQSCTCFYCFAIFSSFSSMTSWRVQNDGVIMEAGVWVWFTNRPTCYAGTSWRKADCPTIDSLVTLKDSVVELLSLQDSTTAGGTPCISWGENTYFSTGRRTRMSGEGQSTQAVLSTFQLKLQISFPPSALPSLPVETDLCGNATSFSDIWLGE